MKYHHLNKILFSKFEFIKIFFKLRVLVGIVNLLILTTSLGANEISSGFLDFLSFEGENADAASVLSTESTFIFRFSDIDAAYL